MKKNILFILLIISPTIFFGQIISCPNETSKFLTAYTNGAPNDTIFVFCQPGLSPQLTATGTGGTAPYTFTWYYYNSTTHSFPAATFATTGGSTTSTLSGLATGGYKVVVTDALATIIGCDIAWIWNVNTTIDAGSNLSGCAPFNLAGTVNTNSTGTFKYYNPQAASMTVSAATTISVCFNIVHTYVSDLAFHLVGPASCGSPDIVLCPNPGVCNSGDNCTNLCFTTASAAVLNICSLPAHTLTGTYGRYGTGGGTAINWSPLYGCNAAAGGWRVQVYDCANLDVGTLTDATITFTGVGSCGADVVSYYSGIVNSAINDNTCTAGSASSYTVSPDTFAISVPNTITWAWTAAPSITINTPTTSLTPLVPVSPLVNTTFYLTVNGSHGCPLVDSLFYTFVAPTTPVINPVSPICSSSSPVTLSASPSGGVFSGTGVSGGAFNPSGLSGTFTITYNVSPGGCPTSTSTTVTVTTQPVATFNYTGSPFCTGPGSNPAPNFTGGGVAGVFSASPAGLNFVSTSTGVVNLATSVGGNYTITNTIAAAGGCATLTSTFPITLTQRPVAAFNYPGTPFCSTAGAQGPTFIGTGVSGTYTASAGLVFNASTGVVNIASTPVGTYTVYNHIAPATGCPAVIDSTQITIIAAPVASFSYTGTPYCAGGTNPSPTFSGGGIAGTFSSTAGLVINPTTGVVDLTTSTAGTYLVINAISATAGCAGVSAFAIITITPAPLGTFSYSGSPYCTGGSNPAPSFSGGGIAGTFTSTSGLVINSSNGVVDLNLSTPGTYTVTNTVGSGGCAGSVATASITINPAPTATFAYTATPYCQSAANPSPAFGGGSVAGTFSSSPGLSINSVTGIVNLAASTPGTYTITNTIAASGGCSTVTASSSITIVAAPVATFAYTGSPYCQGGANPAPTMSGAIGTFTSTAGLIINSSTGVIDITTSTPGTYTVTNTIGAGVCPVVSATTTVVINPAPTATFSYTASPYCQSASNPLPTFSGSGLAGVFTSSAGLSINASTGLVTLSGSTAGTYTVTNTIAAAGGCATVTASSSITITAPGVATFNYPGSPFCQGGVNPSPTFSGGGIAGTFSSTAGLIINTSTGIIDLASSTPGTYIITNTIAAGVCPVVNATASVTINASPTANFSYTGSPYCQSGVNPTPTLSGGSVAGTFSSTVGLSINSATGLVNLAGSTAGTYVVTNTIAAAGACSTITATASITITPVNVTTFSYTGNPYCQSSTNPLPTFSGGGVAGTFTSSPGGLIINSVTGLVDLSLSAPATYTITNTIAAGTCPSVSATFSITITAMPVANFSYIGSPFCTSGVNPSPTFSGGGVAGIFSSTAGLVINSSTGVINLSGSTPGTYCITNAIPAAAGCSLVTASFCVTIVSPSVATFSYTGTPYCQGGTNPSPTFSGGGVAGIFSSIPGLVINSSTGVVDLTSSAPGTYTVTNTIPAGTCAAVIATSSITITPTPIATFTYSASPYCSAASNPLPTFTGGGVAGIFSSTGGLVINFSTGLINLLSSTPGTYTITNLIPAGGGCASTSASVSVTITAPQVAAFSYTGTPYCQGGASPSPTFSGGGVAGTFTSTPGLVINSSTGIVDLSLSAPGTYTVTNTIAAGVCPVVVATSNITITAAPIATFTYSGSPYCSGGTNPLPTFIGGGTGGIFSSTAGLVINFSSGLIDLTSSTTGTYTVTNTIPASGGCASATATASVTINAMPIGTFSYTGNPYCQSSTNPLPTFSGGGVGGAFTSTAGLVINSASGLVNLASSTIGSYTVTNTIAAGGGCAAVIATSSITVASSFDATFSYVGSPYCQGGANPSPVFTTGSAGVFSSTVGLIINSSTGIIDLTTSTPGTYTVTNTLAASGSCPGTSSTFGITITTLPIATFSYTGNPYCQSSTNPLPTFSGGGVGGTFTSTAGLVINSSTGLVDLLSSTLGTYTVTNTIAASGGCSAVSATSSITIASSFDASFTYVGSPYCQGGANPSPVITGSAGVFSSTVGLVINSSTGVIDLTTSTPGTYTITNTLAASGSCPGTSSTFSITITALPIATFSYTGNPYCQSSTNPLPTFTGGGVAGTFTSTAGLVINSSTGLVDLLSSTLGTYTVTNTIAAGSGCSAVSATSSITIVSSFDASFTYVGSPYCQGGANPSPVIIGSTDVFSSTVGLVINSSTGIIDLTTSTPGIYTVTNTIAASGSCPAAVSTFDITITTLPIATFSYTASPYCQSSSNPLPTFSVGGTAGTFTATAGLVINSVSGLVDLLSSALGISTVTNTIAASGGCPVVTATSSITIVSAFDASFSYSGSPYCQGGANPSPVLGAGASAGTYSSTIGLVIDGITGVIDLSTSSAGTFTITNTIAASGTCPSVSSTFDITINALPVATFSYTGDPYCATGTNPIPTFSGSGTAGTFTSTAGLVINSVTGVVDLSTSTFGTYTVTNTIASSGPCPAVVATTTITVNPTPVASFNYAGTPYCQGGVNPSPTFTGGGVAGTFASSAGLIIAADGTVDLSTSTPGTYTVYNSIAATTGCATETDSSTIVINPLPIATFSYTGNPYCPGGSNPTPTFSGGGFGGVFSSTAGLVIDGITGVVDLTLSATGTYIVTNTIAAAGPCGASSATDTVTINSPAVATFNYSSVSYCSGDPDQSPVFVGGGVAGVFSITGLGLGIDAISGLISVSTGSAGTYTITNTITSGGSCPVITDTTLIVVNAVQDGSFTYPAHVFCTSNGNPLPLSIAVIGGVFTSSPAGLSIDAAVGLIDLTTSTIGTYFITYTTPGPCAGSMIDTITIVNPPVANAGANVALGCGSPTASLDATASSIGTSYTYSWITIPGNIISGGTTTTPVVSMAGTYVITVTDTLGLCSSTDTVIVTQTAAPVAAFTADPMTGAPPLTVNLTNTSTNATIYNWDFGNGSTSGSINPATIYTANGSYTITLIASDTAGCADTTTATIVLDESYTMISGTVFTPNNDNMNDVFYLNSTGVATLEGDIFDRWGLKIFTFHAPNEGWDGHTTSGVAVQEGTYYFIVKATGFDGVERMEKGFITLMR